MARASKTPIGTTNVIIRKIASGAINASASVRLRICARLRSRLSCAIDGSDGGEDGDAEYGALPDAMEVMIDSIREKLKKKPNPQRKA
jgi:hypothetical protein